jgi:hypothetical protein
MQNIFQAISAETVVLAGSSRNTTMIFPGINCYTHRAVGRWTVLRTSRGSSADPVCDESLTASSFYRTLTELRQDIDKLVRPMRRHGVVLPSFPPLFISMLFVPRL